MSEQCRDEKHLLDANKILINGVPLKPAHTSLNLGSSFMQTVPSVTISSSIIVFHAPNHTLFQAGMSLLGLPQPGELLLSRALVRVVAFLHLAGVCSSLFEANIKSCLIFSPYPRFLSHQKARDSCLMPTLLQQHRCTKAPLGTVEEIKHPLNNRKA